MTPSLRDLARQKLEHLQKPGASTRATSIDWIWLLSSLQSTIEQRFIEPEIDTLKHLTAKARIWEELQPAWPLDRVGSVTAAIVASHRLAIIRRDDEWLTQLHACWEASPIDVHYLLRLRVQGEIGLALAPGGPRPFGWDEEELLSLEDGGFLLADAPADRAWRALAKQDQEAARRALADYEQILAALPEKWEAAPREGLRQILGVPDALLQVELRALATLRDRARP